MYGGIDTELVGKVRVRWVVPEDAEGWKWSQAMWDSDGLWLKTMEMILSYYY